MLVVRRYLAVGTILAQSIVQHSGTAGTSVTQATAVSNRILGVVVNTADVSDGEFVDVCELGLVPCKFGTGGGSIGFGAFVTTDSSGLGAVAAPAAGVNNSVIGRSRQSGASNAVRLVLVCPTQIQG